jgi:PAS domain S-box-containing protein
MPRLPRYWPIVAVFVAMTILQASVAALSIQLLSSVRAYVAGESLYSKAQKDAQIYLLDYAEKHREADYARFMSALAIPLGDRAAREALQRQEPDIAAARQGFIDGGNHPDDIDGLIRLFRWFQRVPFMSTPIATWTQGDLTIQEMRALADRARDRIRAGDPQSPAVEAMRSQSPILNERLMRLTSAFSSQLGEASRTTQRLLLGLNSVIAVLLMISGLGFVRGSMRIQAAADLRMERLIHAVTDGVVTIDEDRQIVLFNRAAETMFGIEAIEALGNPIDRFIEHLSITNSPATAGSPPVAGSLHALTGRKRDGRPFPIEASLSRLQMERGALTTIVLRDITARLVAHAEQRAHEALEASNRAKTEFLSRMSHELRTPLNAVIGFSKLLRLDTVKPLSTEQLERVQHVENAGAHLLALVNDVLDLSRIESGEMSVSPEAVQLLSVVEEAATMVSPLVTKAGIEIFLATELPVSSSGQRADARLTPPGDVWVNADPVRLRQVLVNLLSNAVKYNRPGGRVALTWRRAGNECEILITDTGMGIPADQLACLFQPFNRLGAESSAVEGTGIGLVLSRQLADMMGGTLGVTSTLGVGTCASLRLGIASAPAVKSDPASMSRSEERGIRSLSVLYAEDDEVNAELVRQLVTMRRGVSLRVAVNGALALESARADPPDLMLVDMNLGDMTGIELALELRRDRTTRSIRLVALSADALPEQIRAAMACGFESYLTKPINFEELLAVLDAHSQETFI